MNGNLMAIIILHNKKFHPKDDEQKNSCFFYTHIVPAFIYCVAFNMYNFNSEIYYG